MQFRELRPAAVILGITAILAAFAGVTVLIIIVSHIRPPVLILSGGMLLIVVSLLAMAGRWVLLALSDHSATYELGYRHGKASVTPIRR